MRCARAGCNRQALGSGNYCAEHRPRHAGSAKKAARKAPAKKAAKKAAAKKAAKKAA